MSLRNIRKLLTVRWVAALVIASSSSTAGADSGLHFNIPAAAPKSDAAAEPAPGAAENDAAELPLPYRPWQGTSFGSPPAEPARDKPLPFARSPELRRRPYELTLAPALFLPTCGDGSIDGRGCASVALGSGVEAAVLYRAVPFFAIGGEGLWSGLGGAGGGALSAAGGSVRFFGVVGRAYFADTGRWDPYASLSIGHGRLELGTGSAGASGATSGWGGRVTGGLDYLVGSHFRFGPTVSLAQLLVWSELECSSGVCRERQLPYGRLLGFATLGLRLSASLGTVL
ncbi:MAG TPA: hypothetical protein VIW29_00600 [Polyangiaceae bacterium]